MANPHRGRHRIPKDDTPKAEKTVYDAIVETMIEEDIDSCKIVLPEQTISAEQERRPMSTTKDPTPKAGKYMLESASVPTVARQTVYDAIVADFAAMTEQGIESCKIVLPDKGTASIKLSLGRAIKRANKQHDYTVTVRGGVVYIALTKVI